MKSKLSGVMRFRVWRNMLILQVEEKTRYNDFICGEQEVIEDTIWRDAKITDLTIFSSGISSNQLGAPLKFKTTSKEI